MSDDRCCNQDYGGSHYHCSNCGAVTGMLGHYITLRPGVKWAEDRAKILGVGLPFQGFSCAVEPPKVPT